MKHKAFIVRNQEEFLFIDEHFLKNFFGKDIDYDYDELIKYRCDGIKQDLILYEVTDVIKGEKRPGWDRLVDFKREDAYDVHYACVFMRKKKLNKICQSENI